MKPSVALVAVALIVAGCSSQDSDYQTRIKQWSAEHEQKMNAMTDQVRALEQRVLKLETSATNSIIQLQ